MAETNGEGEREKEVLKILEGWLRRIFGFEKVKKREIKEKDLFKSEYLDAKGVARILIALSANVNRLEADMNWVKRLIWIIIALIIGGNLGIF